MRSTWSEQPMTTASNLIASARTKPWPGTGPQTFTAAWSIRPSRPSATLASPKSCQSLDVGRHTTGANQPNDAYSTAPCSSASPSTTMRTPPTHPMRPQPASSRTPASMPWLKSPQRQTCRHQAGRAWILMVELRGFEPLTSSMPWKRATNCAIAPRAAPDYRMLSPVGKAALAACFRAVAMVSMAASSWATERNHASKADGGNATPPSSIAWKNRP